MAEPVPATVRGAFDGDLDRLLDTFAREWDAAVGAAPAEEGAAATVSRSPAASASGRPTDDMWAGAPAVYRGVVGRATQGGQGDRRRRQREPRQGMDPLGSYAVFKRAWVHCDFSTVHFAHRLAPKRQQNKISEPDMLQLLFAFIAARLQVRHATLNVRTVGSVYALYTLHQTQIVQPQIAIRVSPECVNRLLELRQQMIEAGHADVVGLLAAGSHFCVAWGNGPISGPDLWSSGVTATASAAAAAVALRSSPVALPSTASPPEPASSATDAGSAGTATALPENVHAFSAEAGET